MPSEGVIQCSLVTYSVLQLTIHHFRKFRDHTNPHYLNNQRISLLLCFFLFLGLATCSSLDLTYRLLYLVQPGALPVRAPHAD